MATLIYHKHSKKNSLSFQFCPYNWLILEVPITSTNMQNMWKPSLIVWFNIIWDLMYHMMWLIWINMRWWNTLKYLLLFSISFKERQMWSDYVNNKPTFCRQRKSHKKTKSTLLCSNRKSGNEIWWMWNKPTYYLSTSNKSFYNFLLVLSVNRQRVTNNGKRTISEQ